MKKITNTDKLKDGDVLAKDVYNDNILVMAKDRIIHEDAIQKLIALGIYSVYTYDETDTEAIAVAIIEKSQNTITSTEEFKRFKEQQEVLTKDVQSVLTECASGHVSDATVHKIFKLVENIESAMVDDNSLIEMLQCLRSYDDATFAHSLNTSIYASLCAKWNGESDDVIRDAKVAALLHDIGKIKIAKSIVCKQGKLSDSEFTEMKKHPIIGYQAIKDTSLSEEIKIAVLEHHEKCDESGYPLRMGNVRLGKLTKILTIADVYEAMTAKRCYREPMCPFSVISIMESEAYAKYDYNMISKFLFNMANAFLHRVVLLTDGRIGEIVFINNRHIAAPMINVNGTVVNLDNSKDVSIRLIV